MGFCEGPGMVRKGNCQFKDPGLAKREDGSDEEEPQEEGEGEGQVRVRGKEARFSDLPIPPTPA